jgi:hypothetical protein
MVAVEAGEPEVSSEGPKATEALAAGSLTSSAAVAITTIAGTATTAPFAAA